MTTDRGDVTLLLDASATPLVSYRYDAFGRPSGTVTASGTLAAALGERQILRYATYAWDAESATYYCSARTYDPASAQFISKDPAKADGEESPYQYCGGDPVGKVDPSGEVAVAAVIVGGAVVVVFCGAVLATYYTVPSSRRAMDRIAWQLEKRFRLNAQMAMLWAAVLWQLARPKILLARQNRDAIANVKSYLYGAKGAKAHLDRLSGYSPRDPDNKGVLDMALKALRNARKALKKVVDKNARADLLQRIKSLEGRAEVLRRSKLKW